MPKKNDIADKEFLELVKDYIPEETTPQQVEYAEAETKNAKAMIEFWENIKAKPDMDEEGKAYCERVIEGYRKELQRQEESGNKVYTHEQIMSMLNELKKSPEFSKLPIPLSYLEAVGGDEAKDELSRIALMKKQVGAKDGKERLENYKDYLLDKIDRRKLDKKLSK